MEELFETTYLKDIISRCEDIKELKGDILPKIQSQQEAWVHKINEIIKTNGYTKSQFADLCGVSRVSVDKWCKGSIPKSREIFLKIGMAAKYNIEQMNQLLQRYGKYPSLYSKSLEDCIWIYVINHYDAGEAIEKYKYISNKIRLCFTTDVQIEAEENMSTVNLDAKLFDVRDEMELEQFIKNNVASFSNAYHKFYAYVKMHIKANYMEPAYVDSVFEIAEIQGWTSSLRQCVSAIRQNKWYPTRNKIISLGLHLSMTHDQIDEMLILAHMEPLCAKNVFESVIMFILEDAGLNDMMDIYSEQYDPDELCNYARRILCQLNIPEIEDFISELPEADDEWG